MKVLDKALYFLRNTPGPVDYKIYSDSQVIFGELTRIIIYIYIYIANSIPALEMLLREILIPMAEEQEEEAWGACTQEEIKDFKKNMDKFGNEISEALNSIQGEVQLRVYDEIYEMELRQGKTPSQELVMHFEGLMEEWNTQIIGFIEESTTRMDQKDAGPLTELDYWKNRQTKLTSITEQMKSKHCKLVVEILNQCNKSIGISRSKNKITSLMAKWKSSDIHLTEALNEAKDNMKYLKTLESFMNPLYIGTPQTVIDSLPPLLNSIKMIHTIARYYNKSDKMTSLFTKISNQMITNCKKNITKNGSASDLWKTDEYPPAEMIKILQSCIKLNEAYKDEYYKTKGTLQNTPKGKQFDFSESQIFGKFDMFIRRVTKLISLFGSVEQFETLARHNLEGIEEILRKFGMVMDDLKSKNHNLLDYESTIFDRDFIEFNVEVSNLETSLQQFINRNFDVVNNIEHSIKFLRKFQSMLRHENLKQDLTQKYSILFHNYGLDLHQIQEQYQTENHNPPLVRNMPPVSGTITWTRHLYERIYRPLRCFPRDLFKEKDSKKYLTLYNNIAECLIKYEIMLLERWGKIIDHAKSGMQATLLVRHPNTPEGKLCVNFDEEIKVLIRESKCLSRMGIHIKESAKIVLLQEEKFKHYYNELQFLIKEYYRIVGKVRSNTRKLVAPHIEDLEFKLKPGMVTLTWTSLNINDYLTGVHESLQRFEQMINQTNDIMDNRIEKNLRKLSKSTLVELPMDSKPFSLDFFVEMQEQFIKGKSEFLKSKNLEVETAVEDLIDCILNYPRDEHTKPINVDEVHKLSKYYTWSMYQALLHATKVSLNSLKNRVCDRRAPGQLNLKPFFEVEVTLEGSVCRMSPTLPEIQKSINMAANAVLKSTKRVENWNQKNIPNEDEREPFYDWIAKEKEIVKVILLLTGSIQGTKNKVNQFLDSFRQYEWLWVSGVDKTLHSFSTSNPSLEAYEDELKKFNIYEEKIYRIEPITQIGAMALMTSNLQHQLTDWVEIWKMAYAQDIKTKANYQLETLFDDIKQFRTRLKKEVKDIDSLGDVMRTLEDIRKKESQIEMELRPVNEMYDLLDLYLPNTLDVQDREERDFLKKTWKKLLQEADDCRKNLQVRQTEYKRALILGVKNLVGDVKEFRRDFEANGPMVIGIPPREALDRLKRFSDEYLVRKRKFDINYAGENLFNLTHKSYPELEKTNQEISLLKKLYNLYQDVLETINTWREIQWSQVNQEIKEMNDKIEEYSISCQRLPRKLKEWEAYDELREKIDSFQQILPLVSELVKSSIRDRHWQELMAACGRQIPYMADDFLLGTLIDIDLLKHQELIEDLGDSADKQLKIEITLRDDIQKYWNDAEFDIISLKTRPDIPCVLSWNTVQEIQEKIEEHMMQLNTMNAMRHVLPFKKEVQKKLYLYTEVNDMIEKWGRVQVLWTSLESVFRGGDIAKQMPLEAKKFQEIDKKWLKIMERANESKNVIICCTNDMLKDFLSNLQEGLEHCQHKLENYLEVKKKIFPRFYFVSDSDLLKILSQGSDPNAVQDDFEKLFDAITKVVFDPKGKKLITHIMQTLGGDNEVIELVQPTKCEGNIEVWLNKLETEMVRSMREISRTVEKDVTDNLADFIQQYPSQMALAGLQVLWAIQVERAIEENQSGKNKKIAECTKDEILKIMSFLTELCLEKMDSRLKRTKIETLVTVQVHQRDVFLDHLYSKLVQKNLKETSNFYWQQHTRVYWKDSKDSLVISITDVDFSYCYEFLGAKERLCITPLTDRCYITLAQALGMHYGGAPAGPAGTGKTETVKDMGRTLGIRVVVTNCSEQFRYRDTAKIFKGLCQSGLWGCFDEFNRISLEVLSVVAMQIECMANARKLFLPKFSFPDEPEPIINTQKFAYFITMNPGYAGRVELPENLKVLFRGVAMMVPDKEIIIKVKLASVGYRDDCILGKKFKMLYQLCDEQLSKQIHYDFGLRNILSVLRTAGNTKRVNVDMPEDTLIMRTLRDMNLSKLIAEDQPLFDALLKDIFAKELKDKGSLYPDVERKARELIIKKDLIIEEAFVTKILQLYETSIVRHGFMLVGETGTGKSTIVKILTEALSEVKMPTRVARLNPKSITEEEMYGKMNISGEWTTGVFSALWERNNKKTNKFASWIVCDGPVDANWIESLNTVLDDNKILTLANNDRIPMSEISRLVFEVENLINASPATVSRCGIIYISPSQLGWEPLLQSWLKRRSREKISSSPEEPQIMNKLVQKYIRDPDLFTKLDKEAKLEFYVNNSIRITNFLNLLTSLLAPYNGMNLDINSFEKYFLFSVIWAIAGLLEPEEREKFHIFLEDLRAPLPQIPFHKRSGEKETVYEHTLKDIGPKSILWENWDPEKWVRPKNLSFSQLLIPTIDSTRAEFLISKIGGMQRNPFCSQSVLLIGGTGTAKTSTILMYASKFNENMLLKRMNFSSATTPKMFQEAIEGEIERRTGKNYEPQGGKKMTVFLDDMSMPAVNKWDDQETLEIVRQLIEEGGFYFLAKDQRGDFKTINNLQYVGAMNHPGGGKNNIPNRLKRHFFSFNMVLPSQRSVDSIYGHILRSQFKPKKYTAEVLKVIDLLTDATISIWTKVGKTLLPSPSKFHYVFNMRELSRIFQGFLQITKRPEYKIIQNSSALGNIPSDQFLVALWRHECRRVFEDKLTNEHDKSLFKEFLDTITLDKYSCIAEPGSEERLLTDILFCDFLRSDEVDDETDEVRPAPQIYEAIPSLDHLRKLVYEKLEEHNAIPKVKKMDLVLFDDALRQLLRINRVIQMPRGSLMLVGVGGSGKQSLTKLSSFISNHDHFQITLNKGYGFLQLKEDIKSLYRKAGPEGKSVSFILTDAEIKNEGFLEYISSFMATGEISGLIPKEEKDSFTVEMKNVFAKEVGIKKGEDPSMQELWTYFINRVRDCLHIILSFSPVGARFQSRFRKFPTLFNSSTINWFLPWPLEALVSVSNHFLESFTIDCTQEEKEGLIGHMGGVHMMVNDVCTEYYHKMRRHVYVTPKSYLSFIDSYKDEYSKQYLVKNNKEANIRIGLLKLKEGAEGVEIMKIDLKKENQKLEAATEKTIKLVKNLEKEGEVANRKAQEVQLVKEGCEVDRARIQEEQEAAERELAVALPFQNKAEQALKELHPKDIQELRTYKAPRDVIRLVLDGVQLLLNLPIRHAQVAEMSIGKESFKFIADSFDDHTKVTLNTPTFLNDLFFFGEHEKDYINDETCELLEPYLNLDRFFNPKVARVSGSRALGGLCTWVEALKQYHNASKIVKPKMAALEIKTERLRIAEAELAEAERKLKEANDFLDSLKREYNQQMEEKERLKENSNRTRRKMDQANRLITGLSDERIRWTKDADEFHQSKKELIGDVALACSFISYCGPFNAEYRQNLLSYYFKPDLEQKFIPYQKNLDILGMLVDNATKGEWNLQGLPSDDLSIQNAIMVTRSSRFPLLIDPQGQALAWIKGKESDMEKLNCIFTVNNPNLKEALKVPLSEGWPCLIEGIDQEVDPMLDPLLGKQYYKKGKRYMLKLGDAECDFDIDFRLYLTSRLGNPHFSPELAAKTTIIDFTVTQTGLEQQLLGKVISKEQRSLEETLKQLLEDVTTNTKNMQDYNEQLLTRLAESSETSLLDDIGLIEVLGTIKTKTREVQNKLKEANEKKKEISEKRLQYLPVATRGSVLYFCIVEMSIVSWMYNTSLQQFLVLFDWSIENAPKAQLPNKRVENIIDKLTFKVYQYISRGLFEKDKITFLLMVCLKKMITSGKLVPEDVSLFLKAGGMVTETNNKFHRWMTDNTWNNIQAMIKHHFGGNPIPFLRDLPHFIEKNEVRWEEYLKSPEPENQDTTPVPDYQNQLEGEKEIGNFIRLCLVRALREDRTVLASTMFIKRTLGPEYTTPMTKSLEDIWSESNEATPILFLLSLGANPTSSLDDFAKRKKTVLEKISMGEEQDKKALEAIKNGFITGDWVLLANCHLGLEFMSQLEDILKPKTQRVHPKFRLWLTCEPHPQFPLGLLQMSVKVTDEPPNGVKAGLYRTFTTLISEEFFEKEEPPDKWKALVFTLCFMHSVIQERRKFGPIGFSIPYEFNDSDLEASLTYLDRYNTNIQSLGVQMNWETLKYMTCEVQYGGRITDDQDRELFKTIGSEFLKPDIFNVDHSYNQYSDFSYDVPRSNKLSEIINGIHNYPEKDRPELFGLHNLADLSYRMKESKEMLGTLIDTQPKESSIGQGKSMEDVVKDKLINEMIPQLPKDYSEIESKELIRKMRGPKGMTEKKGFEVPLNVVLSQEINRLQYILTLARKMMTDILLAIDGQIIMVPDIVDAIDAIFNVRVPNKWLYDTVGNEISWMTPTLSLWLKGLTDRNHQLYEWLHSETGRPIAYWISGFFNPQGFLTAMKQEVTRQNKAQHWSLDEMAYEFDPMKAYIPIENPDKGLHGIRPKEEGLLIYGLFIQGAVYDERERKLKDYNVHHKDPFQPFPLLYCHAKPFTKEMNIGHGRMGGKGDSDKNTYECPLYKYPNRTDRYLVTHVDLGCGGGASTNRSSWTRRGVALLCSKD